MICNKCNGRRNIFTPQGFYLGICDQCGGSGECSKEVNLAALQKFQRQEDMRPHVYGCSVCNDEKEVTCHKDSDEQEKSPCLACSSGI